MGQAGFFDVDRRLAAISAKGDPLETINAAVPWENFRAPIEAVTVTKPEDKKSNAGRPGYDTVLKLKMVVLQALYNLSDEQLEIQVRDRLSFMRFLGLELHHPVPDATTIWLFREALVKAGLIDKLFDLFKQHLAAKGFIARGGQRGYQARGLGVDVARAMHQVAEPQRQAVDQHRGAGSRLGGDGRSDLHRRVDRAPVWTEIGRAHV